MKIRCDSRFSLSVYKPCRIGERALYVSVEVTGVKNFRHTKDLFLILNKELENAMKFQFSSGWT